MKTMKIMDASSWLEKNKDKYSKGVVTRENYLQLALNEDLTILEIMEGYAKYYHQFKTTNYPTTKDYDHVDLILNDANKHGLRSEVEMTAKNYLDSESDMDIITAYNYAYNDWVK